MSSRISSNPPFPPLFLSTILASPSSLRFSEIDRGAYTTGQLFVPRPTLLAIDPMLNFSSSGRYMSMHAEIRYMPGSVSVQMRSSTEEKVASVNVFTLLKARKRRMDAMRPLFNVNKVAF